jgi:hypothetical protein
MHAELCDDCSSVYAVRLSEMDCSTCAERLAVGVSVVEEADELCAGCAVTEVLLRRARVDVHAAVSAATDPLRTEIAALKAGTPLSPPAKADLGPDGREPARDRCGALLGLGAVSYTLAHGSPAKIHKRTEKSFSCRPVQRPTSRKGARGG